MTITRRPTVPTRSWMTEGLTAGSTEAIETATGSKCQLVLHAPRRPTVPKKLDDGGTDSRIYRSNRNCDWITMQIGFARTTAADRTQSWMTEGMTAGSTEAIETATGSKCKFVLHAPRRPTVPKPWMTEGLTAGSTEAIETATGSNITYVLKSWLTHRRRSTTADAPRSFSR